MLIDDIEGLLRKIKGYWSKLRKIHVNYRKFNENEPN